jgi:hypothetical protein
VESWETTAAGGTTTDYGQAEQKPESKAPASDSVKVLDEGGKKNDGKTTNTPEPD